MSSLYTTMYTPYGANQAEARYSPQTQQVQVMTHLKPIASLPTLRQQQTASNAIGIGAGLYADTKTDGNETDANYDMELGEFVLINPKNLPASSHSGSINVAGFTSLNNITTDDVEHMQVMGVCTAPFSYSKAVTQTGQLSCQISGTYTVINNGPKTIPAMSRVMLVLPNSSVAGKTVSGDVTSKKLPVTMPVTSRSVREVVEGLMAIEQRDQHRGRQVTRAAKDASKRKLLELCGLYFTQGAMKTDITDALLDLTTVSADMLTGRALLMHDFSTCLRLFKVQSYIRRFTIGVALKTTPPGKQLDVCLTMR